MADAMADDNGERIHGICPMTTPDSIRDLAESTVTLEEQVRRERAGATLIERVG
jgi:hypothetical protein